MNTQTIPRPNHDFALESVDDKRVLFHPAKSEVLYLNATAALVFELCDGRRCVDDIVDLLQTAFQDAADIRGDVQATLGRLADYGAISL